MPLDPETEQQLADMPDDQFAALLARIRPPTDPRATATAALRELRSQQHGGSGATGNPAPTGTKAAAAEALRAHRAGSPHRPIRLQTGNKSDFGPAAHSITAATGLPVTHDGGGATY